MNQHLPATQSAATSRALSMAQRLTSPLLEQARRHPTKSPKTSTGRRKLRRFDASISCSAVSAGTPVMASRRTSHHFEPPGLSFQGMKNDTQRRESIAAVVGQFVGFCSASHHVPVFVDVHAGSGYVSHNLHRLFPSLLIIANDFDDNKGTRYQQAQRTESIRQEIAQHFPTNEEHPTPQQVEELRTILNNHSANGEFLDLLTFSRWFVRDIFGRLTPNLDNINRIHPIRRNLPTARLLHYFDGFQILPEHLKDARDYAPFIVAVKEYAEQFRNSSDPFAFFFFFDPPYCSTNCADYRSDTMAGIEITRNNWQTITNNLDAFGYFNSETIAEELTHDTQNIQIQHFATRAGYGYTRDFFAYRLPTP